MKTRRFSETPPERILILDKEESLAETLKIVLEPRYQVATAHDSLQALELIRGMDYDLIISDFMMPRMNGVELYGVVQRERPGLERRILFLSDSLDDSLRRFLKATGSPFLPKPFSIMELLEVVNHFFTTYRLNYCPVGPDPSPDLAQAGGAMDKGASSHRSGENAREADLQEDSAEDAVQGSGCPYGERIQSPIAREFVSIYCHGWPSAEIMVPSLREEKDYCLKVNGYLECPIYRYQRSRLA